MVVLAPSHRTTRANVFSMRNGTFRVEYKPTEVGKNISSPLFARGDKNFFSGSAKCRKIELKWIGQKINISNSVSRFFLGYPLRTAFDRQSACGVIPRLYDGANIEQTSSKRRADIEQASSKHRAITRIQLFNYMLAKRASFVV